jgi:hypothetical protein
MNMNNKMSTVQYTRSVSSAMYQPAYLRVPLPDKQAFGHRPCGAHTKRAGYSSPIAGLLGECSMSRHLISFLRVHYYPIVDNQIENF